ncbi:MAG: hypothetical protein HOC79_00110 [Euryarchaeota archaeon]|jgi:hypothetical protein|nr:hypothetical protein [Euryarchaeota archaeon]
MERFVMALESIELVKDLFSDGWNRANSNQRKPVIQDITIADPGGKRLDLARSDAIVLYETAHNEEQPEVFYDFVHTRINITVDARTTEGRDQLMKMEDEIRRVVHANRKGDGVNFDRLLYKTRTDLSDRTKRLHRMTFQVEIVIFSELIA